MTPEQTIKEVKPRVREYQPEDAPAILAMLEAEGISEEESTFARGVINVLAAGEEIIGFSMLEILGSFAPQVLRISTPEMDQYHVHLKYFCIARGHRSAQLNAWELIKYIHGVVRVCKYRRMIVHARGNRMIRLARAYFRTMPCAQADDGTAYLLVEI